MDMREFHKKWNEAWEEGFHDGLVEAKQVMESILSHGQERSDIQTRLDELIKIAGKKESEK